MATFPSAAAQFQQQQQSPLTDIGRVLALKSLLQQQQFQQQAQPAELQNVQAEAQQKQLALKDQQAMTSAMQQWDGKDINDLPATILKNGGSANAVFGVKQKILDQQDKLSQIAKNDAETNSNNLTTALKKNDQLAGGIQNVLDGPDEELGQRLMSTASDLAKQGVLDPQHVQTAQQLAQSGDPAAIRQQLQLMQKGTMSYSQQIKAAQDNAELASKQAQLPGQQAESSLKQQEAAAMQQFGGLTQGAADAKYRFLLQKQNQGQATAPEDQAFMKAYERQKTLNTQFQFSLQNQGATGAPGGQPSAIATALANGSMKWQDVVSPRTPMSVKTALLGEVKGINPNYNSGDFAVEQDVKKAFTSGAYSQQLNAINTAREHMKTFSSLADALNNGDIQAANKIGNAVGVQFGNDRATNFKIAAQAFGGEVGRAFDGAGVTQAERESASSAFNPNMSPQQLKGAVTTVDSLLSGKQRALQQTYTQGTQAQPNFGNQGGAGKIQILPNEPKGIGPNGDTIVVRGGKWVDTKTGAPVQ